MCSRAIPSLWFDLNNRFGKCFNFVMYHHFFKSFSRLNISTRLCRVEACLRLFRNPLNNPGRYRVLSYLVQNQSINISINAKQASFLINIVSAPIRWHFPINFSSPKIFQLGTTKFREFTTATLPSSTSTSSRTTGPNRSSTSTSSGNRWTG